MTKFLEIRLNGIADKVKYLRTGISTSISYLGISIIRESTKILIVNSQLSCQLVGGGDRMERDDSEPVK